MTSPITAKACEAWFVLEAADLRGLPAPFVVKAYVDRVELGLRTAGGFELWADALDADVKTIDTGGLVQRSASGLLHEYAVTVFVSDLAGVLA